MKKRYLKHFILCLIVLLTLAPYHTHAEEQNGSGQIVPLFSNIDIFRSTFEISNDGKTSNAVFLDARNVDKVVVEAYLQQYKGGKWITVKNWSNSKEGTTCSLSQDWYVARGYSYRLVTYGYVYQGLRLVESTSDTSSVSDY